MRVSIKIGDEWEELIDGEDYTVTEANITLLKELPPKKYQFKIELEK